MNILSVLLPSFVMVLLGMAMRRWLAFGDSFWQELERANYYILFPALLFLAVARSGPAVLGAPGFIETALLFTAVGILLGYASKLLFRLEARAFASIFQCAFRFSAYIGFAIMGGISGEAGIATFAVLTSILVPPINALSIMALASAGSTRWLREVLTNPLVLSTTGGLLYSSLGGQLPAVLGETLKLLSNAALPLGLIAVGAGFRWFSTQGARGVIGYLVAVKLICVPAVAFLVARSYGLGGEHFHAVLVLAALPTATNAYILAARMGGDGALVASVVTANILVAMFTLPLWLSFAGVR